MLIQKNQLLLGEASKLRWLSLSPSLGLKLWVAFCPTRHQRHIIISDLRTNRTRNKSTLSHEMHSRDITLLPLSTMLLRETQLSFGKSSEARAAVLSGAHISCKCRRCRHAAAGCSALCSLQQQLAYNYWVVTRH